MYEEKINEWTALCRDHKKLLEHWKKGSREVLDFLNSKYKLERFYDEKADEAAVGNISNHYQVLGIQTEKMDIRVFRVLDEGAGSHLYSSQKSDYADYLKEMDADPEIEKGMAYPLPILVNLDMNNDYVYAEGSPALADELLLFQGLNTEEKANVYLAARYIRLCLRNAAG